MTISGRLRDALDEIERTITSTLQTDEVMQGALDAAVSALDMDGGIIEVRDDSGWCLRYVNGFSDGEGEHVPPHEAPLVERAVRLRRPFTVADLTENADLRVGFFRARAARSVAVVPITVKDEVNGCLILVTREREHVLNDEEMEFAERLASAISLALDNARLYEVALLAQQQAELELDTMRLLLRAADTLSSSMDLGATLDVLANMIVEATKRSRVVVSLYDSEQDELVVQTGLGFSVREKGSRIPLSELSPGLRRSIHEKVTLALDSNAPEIRQSGTHLVEEIGSELILSVPLVFQERVTGHVRVDEPGSTVPFGDRDIQVAEAIASQAAVAIENARLFEAERERARLAEVITEIDADLHSSSDRGEMMRRALRGGALALGAETGALSTHGPDGFIVRHAYGFSDELVGRVIPDEREQHSLLALRSRQPVVVEDVTSDLRVDAAHLLSYGIGAVLVVPLVVAGTAVGNLYYNFPKPRRFAPTEVEFARRLGASLSLAMENARMLETERANTFRNEALARIDLSIHSTLDRDQILQRVAEESAGVIGADSTVLCIVERGEWVVRYSYNMSVDIVGQAFNVEDAPFMGIAAETGRTIALDDAFNDVRAVRETQEALGVRAVMMTPLVVREEVVGGLFFNYMKPRHFTSGELEYASRLGASVGLAMANGLLYEAERDLSNRLQEALLTMPERVPGVELAHAYHAATEAARVGGDFYDVFEVNDHLVGVTIGDVAGSGVDAAVLTSLAKNALRAYVNEGGEDLRQVLQLTNELVFKGTPTESFITAFFGILDKRDGRFVYANAGHPPPVLSSSDGQLTQLDVTGPLLGAFSGAEYEQSEVFLGPDDWLFLYTDGLSEARGEGGLYGSERLLEVLASCMQSSASQIVDCTVGDVLEFTHDRLRDDMALLVVKADSREPADPRRSSTTRG